MPEASARRSEEVEPEALESARLTRAERRDALLDAAVALATSGDVAAVSMETVAERAGVSRPLVYKHFANRNELLAAVYQREAVHLHRDLATEVGSANSLEGMFRTLIRGSLRAAGERGHVFASLRSAGAWNRELRHEQRARDANTVRACSPRSTPCSRSGASGRPRSTPRSSRRSTWAWSAVSSTRSEPDEGGTNRACRVPSIVIVVEKPAVRVGPRRRWPQPRASRRRFAPNRA